MNIGSRIKKLKIGSWKGCFAIAILLLVGYALWNMSMPKDMELHQSCVYADSLTGAVVEVNLKHHETSDPWRCHFGTKVGCDEVLESFRSQDTVLAITDLCGKESDAECYLLKIDSDLGVLYQELYDFRAPFPKYKRENTYVLQDSIKRIYKDEKEFDILFPSGVLAYDVAFLTDVADELWIEDKSWNYQDDFLSKDETIVNFFLSFYNETDLYHASVEGGTLIVTFDRDALDGRPLNQYQRTRLDRFYKGVFVIEIDVDTQTLTVNLKNL